MFSPFRNQLYISAANQLTGVYMARKLVINGLTHMLKVKLSELIN